MGPLLDPSSAACSNIPSGKTYRKELSSPIDRFQEMGTDSELFDRDQTGSEVRGFDNWRELAV